MKLIMPQGCLQVVHSAKPAPQPIGHLGPGKALSQGLDLARMLPTM